jgi:uncharacterized protein
MPSDFREKIREYVAREALPREKFGHQARLYELTRLIGAGLCYDDDVVFSAAWLHDLGVFAGHRPEDPALLAQWNNVVYAEECAPSILNDAGFPTDKVNAVVEAIRTHQPSGVPVSIEGAIVRDADILEQLGAIGVLRTVCKIGRDTRFPTFTTAVDSLRASLDGLPDQIRLDTTRALAEPKIELLQAFLQGVADEAHGALY